MFPTSVFWINIGGYENGREKAGGERIKVNQYKQVE